MDSTALDNVERKAIAQLLSEGLECEIHPRADTHEQIQEIVARLKASDGTLKSRLVIGGFALTPDDDSGLQFEHLSLQRTCETCMYYSVHRRFCEFPELNLAVAPRWSCRLWRI